jgi:hypothetical protein
MSFQSILTFLTSLSSYVSSEFENEFSSSTSSESDGTGYFSGEGFYSLLIG